MIPAEQVQALEVEYALFNACRTLSSPAPSAMKVCALHGVVLLVDRSRPASTYANRVLGLDDESFEAFDEMLDRYDKSEGAAPRIDLRLEHCTPDLKDGLHRAGFEQTESLCYLGHDVCDIANPADGVDIRRWHTDDADAFLDLLESAGGEEIPAEVRSAKREYYCTDRFRKFVAYVKGSPVAWATLFVTDDGKHGYLANAYTDPRHRGRGLQRELLLARLHDSAELGLETVVTDVEPGTTSLRNCRRVGFQIESVHLLWERRTSKHD